MKKRLRERKPKPFLEALSPGPSLVKHLASCNAAVRSESLRKLQSWLATQKHLKDDEMNRIWKGFFYCLWHSDKAQAQSQLIDRLTRVVHSLELPLCVHYFSCFLITLRREWNGVDHLRLDKFYLLIRRFVRSVFELMRKYNWDLEVLGKFMGVLEKDGFLANDKLLGNGVNYHIASLFLDELKSCFVPVREDVVDALFKPFFDVMLRCENKIMVGKVKNCVFEELLRIGSGLLERRKNGVEGEESYGDVALGLVAMKMGLAGKLYEVGSSEDCVQGNRKVVFGLQSGFLKLEKQLESLGIDIAIPEVNDAGGGGVEVPELIPIKNGESGAGSSEETEATKENQECAKKVLKKCKKVKKLDENAKRKKKKINANSENFPVVDGSESILIANGEVPEKEIDNETKADKKKKKKKQHEPSADKENEDMVPANVDNSSNTQESDGDVLALDESVLSNLQLQFEKVAAEDGLDSKDNGLCPTPITASKNTSMKKRKRSKSADAHNSNKDENAVDDGAKSIEKISKKVSFAMKNNLVWKPQTPLPPQNLRIPPSLTPRGSALKKGVPPGPVREMPPAAKKVKKKKVRKVLKSPALNRKKKVLSTLL